MSERHPHIQQASEEQLLKLLQDRSPELQEIFLTVHRLVLRLFPGVQYDTDTVDGATSYGIRQYGYDGWGMAALSPHTKWVSLHFMRGADLDDPAGILEGSGKRLRHVKIRSLEQLQEQESLLTQLLEQAASLHTGEKS